MLYNIVMILIFIVCVLIILVVLIQNSKGGGLAANFAGSSQIMGVRRTADFLEKATWTLAISLFVLSIIASMSIPRETIDPNKSKIEDKITNMPGKNETPILPNTQPPTQN
ncbi:MAG: preprotein translocase subunit SecG [Bacteroidales bacterium]|nr:preprotein translocase subunit SecG [Bacteroidales bacterium]